MTRLFGIPSLVFCILSCQPIKGVSGQVDQNTDGTIYYLNDPRLKIKLFGDYYFHALKQKYFLDCPDGYIKYLTTKYPSKDARLVYSAHTFVQPYYSTAVIIYNSTIFDSAFVNKIKRSLHQKFKTSFRQIHELKTDLGNAYNIQYEVKNPRTKITSYHQEYFVPIENKLLRFIFWTTATDKNIVLGEEEDIIRHKIQFQPQ